MTDEEKKQLVDAVITQLKSEGTDVSNANIVSDANGIDYVVAYGKNGQIVRAVPTAISSEKVGATGYMNAYTEAGVYNINTSGGEDLPIDNQGAISARLTVLVTESGGNKVITQVLNLNNNEGGEGNVYIRSCQNGEWKTWGKLQTNIEVGQVNTLDNLTDNGIYSGVLTDGTPTSVGTFYDTFVLIVINNYAVSIPTGNPQSISQLKYSLGLDGSISVASRKRDQYGYWDNWASLDEKSRAEQVEQAIKEKAVDADSLNFQTRANVVALNYKTIEEVGDEITIPAATAESAGVMSADDKVKLDNLSQGGVAELMEEVTYSELVALRDNASLVAGMKYRITDYATMTAQVDTSSAGHAFDIIVEALDKDVLSEDAKAVWHDGDDYFAECDLTAWTLKYCLDNDTSRFAWADAENGKGVIYYMKDERDNECPYDFKNIMFKDYFTFSYMVDGVIYDGTVRSEVKLCYGNIIKHRWIGGMQHLNDIVFKNTSFGNSCYSNTFSYNCYSNTFGNSCYSNTFSYNCYSNTFSYNCYSNTFGNYCGNNTLGNNCYSNTFGNYCGNNTLGGGCSGRRIDGSKLSITLNDEYYDDGTYALVPIKHPDLSTQPSILPYKFMGNYVYEQLVPIEGETTAVTLAVAEPFILEARLVGNGFSGAADVEYTNGELHIIASNLDKALCLKIEYTTMENGNNYYEYNY